MCLKSLIKLKMITILLLVENNRFLVIFEQSFVIFDYREEWHAN